MVLLENVRHLRGWDIRILATDIDTNVLSHARCGLYSGERLEKMDAGRLLRWFEPAQDRQHYTVREELRQLISFKTLNLMDRVADEGADRCDLLPQCRDLFRP